MNSAEEIAMRRRLFEKQKIQPDEDGDLLKGGTDEVAEYCSLEEMADLLEALRASEMPHHWTVYECSVNTRYQLGISITSIPNWGDFLDRIRKA